MLGTILKENAVRMLVGSVTGGGGEGGNGGGAAHVQTLESSSDAGTSADSTGNARPSSTRNRLRGLSIEAASSWLHGD
jgi:hypothetical protein